MAVSTVDIYPSGPLIAMLGNPNAGKTSLFNILTGRRKLPGASRSRRTGDR